MEKFGKTLKRVHRYRVARKLLNLITWIISLVIFVVIFVIVSRSL